METDFAGNNRSVERDSPSQGKAQDDGAAWRRRAPELALWVQEKMVVRDDAHGQYYIDALGRPRSCKQGGNVDFELLVQHFRSAGDGRQIGLYTTSLDDRCRCLLIDIDLHDGHPEDLAGTNVAFALFVCDVVIGQGFRPLLIDSNGKGGLHLIVFFDAPVSAREVRAFGGWLVRGWADHGLASEPEVFPKQDSIRGRYGNFTRLFGRHYKRPFWSKVWDGAQWRSGDGAIDIILSTPGDPFDLVPQEILVANPAKAMPTVPQSFRCGLTGVDDWWKGYQGDLRTLNIVSLFEDENLLVSHSGGRQAEVICPWAHEHTSGGESAGVLNSEVDEGLFPAFHCFHAHCQGRGLGDVLDRFGPEAVDGHCAKKFEGGREPDWATTTDRPVVSANDPLGSARAFYDDKFSHGDERTLLRHQGRWLIWDGRKYGEVTDEYLRSMAWPWLATCSCRTKDTKSDPSKLVDFVPVRSHVTATLDALQSVALVAGGSEMPSWIGRERERASGDIIAFANGLLDLGRLHDRAQGVVMPHTPLWFSTNCLPHRYEPEAQCPRWLDFLAEVFEGDVGRIGALARWFGYNLTGDTRQQKFALLVGPPRSGKGTIMTVLTHVLGVENVATPSLTSLGSRFGLAPLVGKQAAIVGDGHLGRSSDSVAVLERLKSIVGEDPQNVDLKGRPEMTNVPIKARFSISVNELPRLPDSSAALRSRMLVFPFKVSFEQREDHGLLNRLLGEVPGITNWALAGLRDLRRDGRLLQPEAGRAVLDDFVRLSSPQAAFVQDCCEVGPGHSVPAKVVQFAWRSWCDDNGHEAGSSSSFGAKIRAALPGLERVRRRVDGELAWFYQGVSLNVEMCVKVEGHLLCHPA